MNKGMGVCFVTDSEHVTAEIRVRVVLYATIKCGPLASSCFRTILHAMPLVVERCTYSIDIPKEMIFHTRVKVRNDALTW